MSNDLKTPFAYSISKAITQKAIDQLALEGKSLPASITAVISPGIVRVKFEVASDLFTLPEVEVPVQADQFVQVPFFVGMKGKVSASSVRLGGVTGQGGGVARLDQPGNLSALSFVPLGTTEFPALTEAGAVDIHGPSGAVIRNNANSHSVKVLNDGVNIDGNIRVTPTTSGFFGTAPVAKPTVVGLLSAVTDANAKAVLESLIGALEALGLITDGTT